LVSRQRSLTCTSLGLTHISLLSRGIELFRCQMQTAVKPRIKASWAAAMLDAKKQFVALIPIVAMSMDMDAGIKSVRMKL